MEDNHNLIPNENTPKDDSLGAELNPSAFDTSTTPEMPADTLLTTPTSEPNATPANNISISAKVKLDNKPEKNHKKLPKAAIIAAIITILNVAISTTAVVICLNPNKNTTADSNETIATKSEEDELPGEVSCKPVECLTSIKNTDNIDAINKKIGKKYNTPSSYKYTIDQNTSLTVNYYSSGLVRSLDISNKEDYSKITVEKATVEAMISNETYKDYTYEQFKKLLGDVDGTPIEIDENTTTYLWANPTSSDPFYIRVDFDTNNKIQYFDYSDFKLNIDIYALYLN